MSPGGGGAHLEDEAVRAGAVILVHLVDDQEDDTGEEGQGKEDQHRHLQAEAAMVRGQDSRHTCPGVLPRACQHKRLGQGAAADPLGSLSFYCSGLVE